MHNPVVPPAKYKKGLSGFILGWVILAGTLSWGTLTLAKKIEEERIKAEKIKDVTSHFVKDSADQLSSLKKTGWKIERIPALGQIEIPNSFGLLSVSPSGLTTLIGPPAVPQSIRVQLIGDSGGDAAFIVWRNSLIPRTLASQVRLVSGKIEGDGFQPDDFNPGTLLYNVIRNELNQQCAADVANFGNKAVVVEVCSRFDADFAAGLVHEFITRSAKINVPSTSENLTEQTNAIQHKLEDTTLTATLSGWQANLAAACTGKATPVLTETCLEQEYSTYLTGNKPRLRASALERDADGVEAVNSTGAGNPSDIEVLHSSAESDSANNPD